jgi:hypothetical protein
MTAGGVDEAGIVGADDRRVGLVAATDPDGEGSLADPGGGPDALGAPHRLLERRRHHAALKVALPVDAVHQHRCRLIADGADESGDPPVLERLLEQDQENHQPDRHHQQPEPDRGPAHLPEGEVHRHILAWMPATQAVRRSRCWRGVPAGVGISHRHAGRYRLCQPVRGAGDVATSSVPRNKSAGDRPHV